MAILISGHPRSGTTLLQELCNFHPEITVTFEFGNLLSMGKPYAKYRKRIRKRIWNTKHRSLLVARERRLAQRIVSLWFGVRYLLKMRRHKRENITLPLIETTLNEMFSQSRIVGDKYPGYIFILDDLINVDGLKPVIIYRDCRDVCNSTLYQIRSEWQGRQWTQKMNSAEKIAKRWVYAIEIMENHSNRLYRLQYENLIRQPQKELEALGGWLGVDPDGFPVHLVRETSIGKYKKTLSSENLKIVEEIAGPTMKRLGYEI